MPAARARRCPLPAPKTSRFLQCNPDPPVGVPGDGAVLKDAVATPAIGHAQFIRHQEALEAPLPAKLSLFLIDEAEYRGWPPAGAFQHQ
jgi:hypothetical protein